MSWMVGESKMRNFPCGQVFGSYCLSCRTPAEPVPQKPQVPCCPRRLRNPATMRDVLQTEELTVPEGVTLHIKSRLITVEGPRGKLQKNVRHVNMDIQLIKSKANKVLLAVWQGGRKHVACLRTIKSLIQNMITGVTRGFSYKMRAVYAHFPINCIIQDDGKALEIRNFLGEKIVRHVNMLDGVTVSESKAQKDEIILEGNDVQNVSQSAASIQGTCRVRNKDIRKFLDGVYVSEKGTVVQA